jgi:hypothetical protein
MSRRYYDFLTIRSEGGLLPPELLRRIIDPKEKLEGTLPEDYGLPQGERLNEIITQSWNRLRKHWGEFRSAVATLPEGEPATGVTNDKWSLPLLRELGFGLLPASAGPEIDGQTYAINRFFGPVPIHLVGCGLSLDRRAAGVRGAAAMNPHGLVQEFLNRSDEHLWAIVSNGLRLRLLRDNQALSRQSFLEFDLEAMFTGEVYSDFVLLWLMAHATRFVPCGGTRPESCLLEQWTKIAEEQGTRALGELRIGVETALQLLGEGFTSHPKNTDLRESLRSGHVTPIELHGQLLRIVYRLIFLFVAEDRTLDGRSLLHPIDESEPARIARERYSSNYSTTRLRDLASKIKGGRHGDLWRQFQIIVGALFGKDDYTAARECLALPVLGSFLWDSASTSALNDAELTNYDLLEALRHLAFFRQGKVLRPVDYKNLGAEELGGVYESLLALTPQISADGAKFTFVEFAGNERKTSGSYYTPDSLVQCLLDSALDPVVEEAIKGKAGIDAEKAILALKVCDPAVGSGHFLVGAAHRLARHLARIRALSQGESEPSPLLYQHALRDIIGRCLYGVDINPMAAELCRVNLWLEALEPGKPLSFLDHHIRVGNSLLGATLADIKDGIPDKAYEPIAGDNKQAAKWMKMLNQKERAGQTRFDFEEAQPWERLGNLLGSVAKLEELEDNTPESLAAKEEHYRQILESSGYDDARLLYDAWCAAFVWPKVSTDYGSEMTTEHLRKIEHNPHSISSHLKAQIRSLTRQYRFFHWHLEFPSVFGTNGEGGFDCVLGNPPWDMQEVKDNEFFALSFPEILTVKSAKDKIQILRKIRDNNPLLWMQYEEYVRLSHGHKHFMLNSRRFPLSAVGRLNLYRVFLEISHSVINSQGRVGLVVPSGFASDSFSQNHFNFLHQAGRIVSLYDFENSLGLFQGVHRSYKFCLITVTGINKCTNSIDFVFFACGIEELTDINRHIFMTSKDLLQLNPLTGTAPLFRSERDRSISIAIHSNRPILADESEHGWQIKSVLMFMVNASMTHHRSAEELETIGCQQIGNHFFADGDEWFPLYEGKMVGAYDHRAASIRFDPNNRVRRNQPEPFSDVEHHCPTQMAQPLFWVSRENVIDRCSKVPNYCLAVKDVTSSSNERTSIAAILPSAALTDSVPWLNIPHGARSSACLCAILNSFCFDYVARQKVAGLHLRGHYLAQLPLIPFDSLAADCYWQIGFSLKDWLALRVLELTYTAWDLEPFAKDCGVDGPPFRWDEVRRLQLRCELDAAFFHLYCVERDDVDYIMETFPIVKRKDEAQYGSYRTKETILDLYDAMAAAQRTGQHFVSSLDPPPADLRCCHPPRD